MAIYLFPIFVFGLVITGIVYLGILQASEWAKQDAVRRNQSEANSFRPEAAATKSVVSAIVTNRP